MSNQTTTSKTTSRLLVAVIGLQLMILAGQWVGAPALQPAQAQFADPGRDRQQTIDELRGIGAKLDKMVEILNSGNLQVRVIQPDENKGKPAAR